MESKKTQGIKGRALIVTTIIDLSLKALVLCQPVSKPAANTRDPSSHEYSHRINDKRRGDLLHDHLKR